MTLKIHQLYAANSLRNFNYIVENASKTWVIDPYDANQIMNVVEQLNKPIEAIINTHEHHDHIRGNQQLSKDYKAEIWAHSNAKKMIPNVSRFLVAGEIIPLDQEHCFEVMDTPGHTHAHLCLLLKKNNKAYAIFTGDTLFNAGVGNCHNGGDPQVLFETIRDHFLTLPDDVLVYPGHDYMRTNLGFTLEREPRNKAASTMLKTSLEMDQDREFLLTKMGEEKQINTFLRLDSPEIIDNLETPVQNQNEVFLTLRQLRNNW